MASKRRSPASKKARSIKKRLRDKKSPNSLFAVAIEWAQKWEEDFLAVVGKLESIRGPHEFHRLDTVVNQLKADNSKRFDGLRNVIGELCNRIREVHGSMMTTSGSSYVLRGKTSGVLHEEIRLYNERLPSRYKIKAWWGRNHDTDTWFVRDEDDVILEDGLDFSEVVAYIQGLVDQREHYREDTAGEEGSGERQGGPERYIK